MSDPIENFNFIEGVNLTDSRFTQTQLSSSQQIVRQYLEDRYQNLDFSPVSGLNDTVVRPTAQIITIARAFVEEYAKSRTLYDALNATGNEKIVDALLSNFLIKRRSGSKTTGIIRVNVNDSSISQYIAKTLKFKTSGGLSFFSTKDVVAKKNPSSASETQIYSAGYGNVGYFIVDVIAEDNGEQYNINKDVQLSYEGSIDKVISIIYIGQTKGGENNESNSSVHNRIISSLSVRNMASPLAIDQTLRDKFERIIYTTSHGVSSKNMKRNAHNLFGIKSGCSCDVYIKNATYPSVKEIHLLASRIKEGNDYSEKHKGKFFVRVSGSDFPGHYDVTSVQPISSNKIIGSYDILQKVRILDQSVKPNELYSVEESAFSKYASTDVIFSEDFASNNEEMAVMCSVTGLDDIGKIQDFVNNGDSQSALIDTLIRACVPCYISISPITVTISPSSNLISDAEISQVISDYILDINPIAEKIRSDTIVSRVMSIPGVIGISLPISIHASIMPPTEVPETIEIRSTSELTIPEIEDKFVGPGTVGFFIEPGGIEINILRGI